MHAGEIILLRRDCDALLIPSGAKISLPKATEVRITQSMGGSYTVSVYGNLARIDAKDADSLGKESDVKPAELDLSLSLEELAWSQMKTCFDPEIPVNIVDLGLIYECKITDDKKIDVVMTLTAPGCGMGPVLVADVKYKLLEIPQVEEVAVELVFDPPWDRSMVSEAAKLQLGIL